MPRRARFVLPGTRHHVTQRGNRRGDVFFSDLDRSRYIELIREHSQRHDLRILGWCLMSNHVHLIVVPGHAKSMALAPGGGAFPVFAGSESLAEVGWAFVAEPVLLSSFGGCSFVDGAAVCGTESGSGADGGACL